MVVSYVRRKIFQSISDHCWSTGLEGSPLTWTSNTRSSNLGFLGLTCQHAIPPSCFSRSNGLCGSIRLSCSCCFCALKVKIQGAQVCLSTSSFLLKALPQLEQL